MSGTPTPPPAGAAADPSMEDILASIRRILSEDESPATTESAGEPNKPEDDVLDLDASMMVAEPLAPTPVPVVAPPVSEPIAPPTQGKPLVSGGLLAPETEAAVASSMGGLLRTLIAEREQVSVYRGGPTIEDLVREEIRPLLKQWLDTNLQPVVERLVRAEIERVVGRGVS